MSAPEFLIEQYRQAGKSNARARADYEGAEHYRSVIKSVIMKHCGESSVAAQEREALASEEYSQHLGKLRKLHREAEEARIEMRAAEYAIEVWRTEEASKRQEKKSYAA